MMRRLTSEDKALIVSASFTSALFAAAIIALIIEGIPA